ncbi:MAG TPA: hypothetical protein VFK47_08910, partial [Ktedonobacteraceae bacterium]|nr:hypothetical protein [Ktedonobacteraceae bacterium]
MGLEPLHIDERLRINIAYVLRHSDLLTSKLAVSCVLLLTAFLPLRTAGCSTDEQLLYLVVSYLERGA